MGPVTEQVGARSAPLVLSLGLPGRAMVAAPGVLAASAAFYVEALPAWAAVFALVLYLVPLAAPGLVGAIALLGAPLVLASAFDLRSLLELQAVASVLIVAVATVPFFLHLGGRFPGRHVVFYVGVPLALLIGLALWTPEAWRLVVTASDVGARAQIVAVFVAVLGTDQIVRWIQRRYHMRPKDPADETRSVDAPGAPGRAADPR